MKLFASWKEKRARNIYIAGICAMLLAGVLRISGYTNS
jgi:hypothetical protein